VQRIWLENSYHVATLDNDQEIVESSTWCSLTRLAVMSAALRREDVAHVAKLARLTLSDAELDRFTEQLVRSSSTPTT